MYLLSSIREAESMSNKGLIAALKADGCFPGETFKGWGRFELVATWLDHYGYRDDVDQLAVQKYIASHPLNIGT